MILSPASEGFWGQNRLTVALLTTVYILLVLALARLIFYKRQSLRETVQSRPLAAAVKISRLIILAATAIVLLLSFKPKADLELGGILLFLVWPFLIGQAVVATRPWEKYLQKDSAVILLYIMYLIAALNVLVFTLKFTGYISR